MLLITLAHAIPDTAQHRSCVGFAGSSALAWLQEHLKIGPMWGTPGDADLLVTGKHGRNKAAFLSFVNRTLDIISTMDPATLIVRTNEFRTYASHNRKIWVVDAAINWYPGNLSFIQCPGLNTLEEAVSLFDIDVCRVICRIHTMKPDCEESIKNNIKRHVAALDSISLSPRSGMTKHEFRTTTKTFRRVLKYQKRGFKFKNLGDVRFRPAQRRSCVRTEKYQA